MGDLWAKIKIWTKGIVFCVLFLYVAFFIVKNYSYTAKVWLLFTYDKEFPTLYLVVFSFLAGVVSTILYRAMRNALHQMHEIRERALKEKFEREHQEKELAFKERLEREHREKEQSLKQKFEREHQEKTARPPVTNTPSAPTTNGPAAQPPRGP